MKHFERKTLSNVEGLTEVLEILGVERPWTRIAQEVGLSENSLRQQIQNVVARRNDIIHRGDRPAGSPESDPQPIDYPWTHSHSHDLRQSRRLGKREPLKAVVVTLRCATQGG
jgi:hypothetical protein